MPKIKPLPASEESNFDGLDELHNVEYMVHRGSKSKKKQKKKVTSRIGDAEKVRADIIMVFRNLLLGRRSLHVGVPFFCGGLFLVMLMQLLPQLQRYNTLVILGLSASAEFRFFPLKSVRAQLVVSLAVLLSVAMDIWQITVSSFAPVLIATIVFVMIAKLCLMYIFLRSSQGAERTRKYLNRRFRLFMIPLFEPKRIMRDVRGRMLAIGWMQLIAVFVYFVLYLVLLLQLEYSVLYLSPKTGASLPLFLILKSGSSALVLMGVLYDTDIRLCLWYFGCLGCAVDYIRKYIRSKRIELKGFPLAFSFAKIRFQMLAVLKLLDIGFGVYGWVIVGYSFGSRFNSLDTRLKIFYSAVCFSLTVFDLWSVALFLGVRWLLRRRKIIKKIGMLIDSDDSEIEEFGLRLSLEGVEEKRKEREENSEKQKLKYQLRMKEEQLRLAESTIQPGKKNTVKTYPPLLRSF